MPKRCVMLIVVTGLSAMMCGCGAPTGYVQHRKITIKGSDTMVILARSWADHFMKENPGFEVDVTGGGSGIGITALINGNADICQSSRPMKPSEKQQVRNRNGVEAKETPVGMDGLAVYVNETNTVPSLTMQQLKEIYTGKIKNWREVGGKAAPMVVYGRDNNSGTHQFFREHVLKNMPYASTIRIIPGTSAIVKEIVRDPASIGYGGIAYASGVRLVPVRRDENSEAVAASPETVRSGQYALSRSLYFYTLGDPSGDIKLFVDWVLGPEGQKLCTAVGYYPLVQP